MKLTERKAFMDKLKPYLKNLFQFSDKDFQDKFSQYYYTYLDVEDNLFLFILYLKIIWTDSPLDFKARGDCLRNICITIGTYFPFNHISEYDFLANQINLLMDKTPENIYHSKIQLYQVYDYTDISFLTEHSIYFCYLAQMQLRNYYISHYDDLKISVSERIRNTSFIANFDFHKITEISDKYFKGVTFYDSL